MGGGGGDGRAAGVLMIAHAILMPLILHSYIAETERYAVFFLPTNAGEWIGMGYLVFLE